MSKKQSTGPETETETGETEDPSNARSFVAQESTSELGFDPLLDLNLPASYDEVRLRFERLQGGRRLPDMN